MNDLTKKAGTHAAALALGAVLATFTPDKHVVLNVPPESTIIGYDANGTDGKDPSQLLAVVKSLNADGTYRLTKFNANGERVKSLGEE